MTAVLPLHVVHGTIVSSSAPNPTEEFASPSRATATSTRAVTPLAKRYVAVTTSKSASSPSPVPTPLRRAVDSPRRSLGIPSPVPLTSSPSRYVPTKVKRAESLERQDAIDRAARAQLYYIGGGDLAGTAEALLASRFAAFKDALEAEEEKSRVALRVDEALAIDSLVRQRRELDNAAHGEVAAAAARSAAARRVINNKQRAQIVNNSDHSVDEELGSPLRSPNRAPTAYGGWTAYKEEMMRQGVYSVTHHGPAGHVPLARAHSPTRGGDAMNSVSHEITVETLTSRFDSTDLIGFGLPSEALMLRLRDGLEAKVEAAHTMTLLNVARELAAEWAHQADVRDAAVRQLLLENRQLADARRANGTNPTRSVVEGTLRRKLAILQSEIEKSESERKAAEARAATLSGNLDALLTAAEADKAEQRRREHESAVEKDALRKELIALKSQVKRAMDELEIASQAHRANAQAADRQCAALQEALAKDRAALAAAHDELDIARAAASGALSASATAKDGEIASLAQKLAAAEQSIERLTAAEAEMRKRLTASAANAMKGNSALVEAEAKQKQSDELVAALRNQLASVAAERDSATRHLGEKQRELSEVTGATDATRAEARRRLSVVEIRLSETEVEAERLRKELADRTSQAQRELKEALGKAAAEEKRAEAAEADAATTRASLMEATALVAKLRKDQEDRIAAEKLRDGQPSPAELARQREAVENAIASTAEDLKKERRRISEQRIALREALELVTKFKLDLSGAAKQDGGSGTATRRVVTTHAGDLDAWSVRHGRVMS